MTDFYQYPWDEAPPEAMWAATDDDGSAWWFKDKPKMDEHGFIDKMAHGPSLGSLKEDWPTKHWRESLRKRPHPHDTVLKKAVTDSIRIMRESLAHWEWPEERLKIVEVFIENAVWRGAVATLDYRHDAMIEKTKGEKE